MKARNFNPAAPGEPTAAGREEVAVLLATRGGVLALNILVQGLLAYALLPAGRGAYAVCVWFGGLAGALAALGSGRSAQYFVMTKQFSVSQGTSAAFAFALAGSALAAALSWPLINSDLAYFGNADTDSFYLAMLLIPMSSLALAMVLQLEGLRRFGHIAAFSLLRTTVRASAILVLVWVLDLGVNGALLALALGHLAMIGACLFDLRRNRGLAATLPTWEELRAVFQYAIREYPAQVGRAIDYRVGGLLLGTVAGRADIGLFAASSALIMKANLVQNAVSAYLLPRAASEAAGRPELTAFCARVTLWAVGGLLLLWVAVSSHVVPLLLSQAFAPVVQLTWILSIGVLAYAGAGLFTAYFRATNRPQFFSFAMWFGLAATVALFPVLYPAWGLHGAAWALTGGLLCRSVTLWLMFHRASRLPLSATLLLRRADLTHLRTSALELARSLMKR